MSFTAKDIFNNNDIDKVIKKLTLNDLTRLFHALELEENEIDQAKGDAQRADVENKAKRVLTHWKKTYPQKATLGTILAALKEANINHMQMLEQKWKGKVLSNEGNFIAFFFFFFFKKKIPILDILMLFEK